MTKTYEQPTDSAPIPEALIERELAGDLDARFLISCASLKRHHRLDWPDSTVDSMKELADQGHAYAQYLLGKFYCDMRSVKDNKKAVFWYTKAAEQGHLQAQFALANFLVTGKGASEVVPDNDERCQLEEKWFRISANNGHADSQFRLAGDDQWHRGYCQSAYEAVIWLKLAAFQEHKGAMFALAKHYRDGNGVSQSSEKAIKWFTHHKSSQAIQCIAQMYHHGIGIEQNLQKAIEFYGQLHRRNDSDASYTIYEIYQKLGNQKKADLYLKLASDRGHLKAQQAVRGFDHKFEKLVSEADLGSAQAQYKLGKLYQYGCPEQSVQQDHHKACEWFKRAMEQGYSRGRYEIGLRHLYGSDGVEQNSQKARELFTICIDRNKGYGHTGLGLMYKNGIGVEQCYKEAQACFERAISMTESMGQSMPDDYEAHTQLGMLYEQGLITGLSVEDQEKKAADLFDYAQEMASRMKLSI